MYGLVNDVTFTIEKKDGESLKISGNAEFIPTPKCYPPPIFFDFQPGYKVESGSLTNGNFEINSGTIEFGGTSYDIPDSRCNFDKQRGGRGDTISVRLMLNGIPKVMLPSN